MELPEGIEKEILEYLHLEYGEDPNDETSLKLNDIVYEKVYEIAGISTHYWRYAPEGKRRWATVEPFGDSYIIGMTNSIPTSIKKNDLYQILQVNTLDDSESKIEMPLENWGNGCFGFSDYKEITFGNDSKVKILVEVNTESAPPSVTLSIKDEDNDVYIRGSVGLSLSYRTKSGLKVFLTIGTGPWE